MKTIEYLIQRPGIFKIPSKLYHQSPSKVMEICSDILITKVWIKETFYYFEGYSERFETAPAIFTQHLPVYDLDIKEDGSHEFKLNMTKTKYPSII